MAWVDDIGREERKPKYHLISLIYRVKSENTFPKAKIAQPEKEKDP